MAGNFTGHARRRDYRYGDLSNGKPAVYDHGYGAGFRPYLRGVEVSRAMAKLANKPRQSEWERYVSRFQETAADASAAEKWQLMKRIYKLGE